MLSVLSLTLPLMYGAHTALAALPVAFEENRGQVAREVAFLARASGYQVFLTRQGAVITAQDGPAVRIRWANSNHTAPVGRRRLLAKSNYLLGPDPARWRTGIANYEGVTYPQAYPGIDLTWHAHGGQIEHDFLVAAGADPRRIHLVFSGAALRLTPDGDLVAGSLRFHQPRAYQGSREVQCRYELHGHSVRFVVGPYDRAQPVTIDPVLSFSTFFGGHTGSGIQQSTVGTSLDGAGNHYLAGATNAVDFPVTPGALQPTPGGGQCQYPQPFGPPGSRPCTNIFVAKFSGDGQTLLYATYLGGGGPADTLAYAIAVGPEGNLYLAGSGSIPKLMPLQGQPLNSTYSSFVAELSADGSSLLYATALPVVVNALAVDSSGGVYLAGTTSGGLPVVNAYQPELADADVFKTTDNGNHWQALRGLPPHARLAVVPDPANPQVLYLRTATGLFKTGDGGMNWNLITNGVTSTALPISVVIDPRSPQTLYLGVNDSAGNPGVYKSVDGGATWVASSAAVGSMVSTLALDPTNPSVLYAATPAGIYRSSDQGATWNLTGLTLSAVQIVVDPTNGSTIFAATTNGVMKSTDAGVTWNLKVNGFAPGRPLGVLALAIDPKTPQRLYAITSGSGLYVTMDGGANWYQTAPIGAQSLLVDAQSRVWVAGSGVFVSQDSGNTWTATSLANVSVAGLAIDAAGALYATSHSFGSDAFAMKLDATGARILYCTYLGGTGNDTGNTIAVDAAGRAYIGGATGSPDFPLAAPLQTSFVGRTAPFITVLDAAGSHVVWSTYFPVPVWFDPIGSNGAAGISSIALDATGDVHLAGSAQPNASPSAGLEAFVAKVRGDGSAVVFSYNLKGASLGYYSSVAADTAGNTYFADTTFSWNLPAVDAFQSNLSGPADGYVAAFNGQTGEIQYATYLGGSNYDSASGIAVDASGNAYVVGSTNSPDFPLKNAWQSSASYTFVTKLAAPGSIVRLDRLTDAASYAPIVAPGELVSLFGLALASSRNSATQLPLPTVLANAQVTVNGVPAPLLYASPSQVNAQIPFETAAGPAQVQVSSSAGTATMTVQVAAAVPAIFSLNQQGTGPGAILHGTTYQIVTGSNPAAAGETISIYCTGLGAVNPPAQTGAVPPDPPSQTALPVHVSIAGMTAHVLYAGVAPGFPGLYQVNAQIPEGTPSGPQPLQIIQNGTTSNTVTLAVQ